MNRIVPLALGVAAACMTTQVAAQMHPHVQPDVYGTAHQSPGGDDDNGPTSTDAGSIAEGLRVEGKCDKAVPMLRPIAERGTGHEIAQFDLGLCLFDLAKAEHDVKHAAELRGEGAEWVLRSANGAFAKAQAYAVTLYLDGEGVAADPVEAEKWAILYHRNGMRIGIGLPDTPAEIRKRLDAAVSGPQEAEARKRAEDWTPPAPSEE